MTDETTPAEKSLLTFPCDFTVKIFGHASQEFETTVIDIMKKHVPDFSAENMVARHSKEGKYRALSITFQAQSRTQLDNLYLDLSASPLVVMAL